MNKKQPITMIVKCRLQGNTHFQFKMELDQNINVVHFVTKAFDLMRFEDIQKLVAMYCESITMVEGKKSIKYLQMNFQPNDMIDMQSNIWLNLKNTYLTMRRIEKEIFEYRPKYSRIIQKINCQ